MLPFILGAQATAMMVNSLTILRGLVFRLYLPRYPGVSALLTYVTPARAVVRDMSQLVAAGQAVRVFFSSIPGLAFTMALLRLIHKLCSFVLAGALVWTLLVLALESFYSIGPYFGCVL